MSQPATLMERWAIDEEFDRKFPKVLMYPVTSKRSSGS